MARSITFHIDGEVETSVSITENEDGSLTFEIAAPESGCTGDLRGVFFDLGDLSADVGDLSITGGDVTDWWLGPTKLSTPSGKAHGLDRGHGHDAKFDVGIEFGTPGMSTDDIHATSFTVSSDKVALSLDMLDLSEFGLRYTSVGEIDGSREGGAKIIGSASGVAENDYLAVTEGATITADLLNDANGTAVADTNGSDAEIVGIRLAGTDHFVPLSPDGFDLADADGHVIASISVSPDGEALIDATGPGADFLAAGETRDFTFEYQSRASDGSLATADVFVTVTGVNDAPVAGDDAFATDADSAISISASGLLANDSDVDSDTLAVSRINGVDADVGATIELASGAKLMVNADGSFDYDPDWAFDFLNAGATGTDSFFYTVSDGDGGTTDAEVTLTVTGTADGAPDAAGVVGYYDMATGQGEYYQANEIELAGHTAQQVLDLSASELAGLDVLYVMNSQNRPYGAEYLASLSAIEAAVSNGMTLIIHDSLVDPAETILPGGDAFEIVRDTATGQYNVDLLPGSAGTIADGPGGSLTDATLDGGIPSSNGYAVADSLPSDADLLLSRTDDGQVVTFGYGYGDGYVVYSSIPLDFYSKGIGDMLGSSLSQAEAEAYAANVIDYGVNVAHDIA